MEVYVYQDLDHNDIEVFKSLDSAQAHAEEMWPNGKHWGIEWEREEDSWSYGEYVRVIKRTIHE